MEDLFYSPEYLAKELEKLWAEKATRKRQPLTQDEIEYEGVDKSYLPALWERVEKEEAEMPVSILYRASFLKAYDEIVLAMRKILDRHMDSLFMNPDNVLGLFDVLCTYPTCAVLKGLSKADALRLMYRLGNEDLQSYQDRIAKAVSEMVG